MKLGLIGGVSPHASSIIYCKVCDKYREIYNAYPEIVIYSIYMPKKIEDDFLANDVSLETTLFVKNQFKKALDCFKNDGINAVGICCNTLSNIFYDVAKEYGFKIILTPINSTLTFLKEKNINEYGVLATGYTSHNKLYGSKAYYLTDKGQEELNKKIEEKIAGKNNVDLDNFALNLSKKFNINNFVLGCTDINSSDFSNNKIVIINSIDAFCNDCLEMLSKKN